MAPLITNLDTFMAPLTRPLAPSSNSRMPHVFVIPPEEEQRDNPPWCCFDADEQPENSGDLPSNPDIHFLDVPYLFQQSKNEVPIPLARQPSVHHPRPRASVSKKLEKKQRPEAIKIIEHKSFQTRQRDGREDSDVIEVVKVKRSRDALTDLEENAKAKRSKTLKARATKALQSIKNVSKASHRTHVKDLWTSTENMPGIFRGVQEQIRSQQTRTEPTPAALPKQGSISRGSLRSLSQIFQPIKPLRTESTFTVRVATSIAPTESHHVLPTVNPPTLPHFRHGYTNSSLKEVPSNLTTNDAQNEPVLQIPRTKKNISTKFSVRELHRLFSFSSTSPDDCSSPTTPTVAPFSSTRSPKPSDSTLSHDCPDVPMGEDIRSDANPFDIEGANRKLASQCRHASGACDDFSISHHLGDLSFEMKLDSLHFDSLSFDPENFHVPREGNVLR